MAHYVHCAACRRAFDAAAGARCPSCPPRPSLIDQVGAASDAELEALRAAIDARLPRPAPAAITIVARPAPPPRRRSLVERALTTAARLARPLGHRLVAALR